MTFEERVQTVIMPLMRDGEDPWNLSPCLLKMAMVELRQLYAARGHRLYAVFDYVLRNRALPPEGEDLSLLRAYPRLFGLCSRFSESPYCKVSLTEAVVQGGREILLRGGVQALASDPILRRFYVPATSSSASAS